MKESFKRKVFVGITWRTFVQFSEQGLQIVFTAILARLLTRADFGIVAMAMLFTKFVRALGHIGFGSAIIQSQEVTDSQVTAIFIIDILINLGISIICFFTAPFVSIFFNQPLLTSIIKVVAWTFLIESFYFPHVLKFKKMQFAGISILEIVAMFIGNIVAIYFAFLGWGVWSLVIRIILIRVVKSIGIWPVTKWRPVWPCFSGIAPLFSFGLNMLGSNVAHYFSQNLVDIIIGKYIDAKSLGSYTIAYNLALLPSQKIKNVLGSVFFPAFSSIQTSISNLKEKFRITLSTIGYFYIPIMLGLSAIAPTCIVVVYGPKWFEAGLFLRLIAIVGLIKGIEHIMYALIIAYGWANAIFKITVLEIGVGIALMSFGAAHFGIIGLISGYVAASIIAFIVSAIVSQKVISDKTVLISATGRSLLAGIIMYVSTYILSLFLPNSKVYSLILQILLGSVVYVILRLSILDTLDKKVIKKWPLPNFVLSKISR